jgi:hypothetical protein
VSAYSVETLVLPGIGGGDPGAGGSARCPVLVIILQSRAGKNSQDVETDTQIAWRFSVKGNRRKAAARVGRPELTWV